jgi:hypothetical protein
VKNLPSFSLLIGYSGYTENGTPYILFKLQEIKRNEALSFFQRASQSRLGVFALSPLFHFQNPKTINALTASKIEVNPTLYYKRKGVLQT